MSDPAAFVTRPRLRAGRSIAELASKLAVEVGAGESTAAVITGVTHDSRLVIGGDLYAALPGAQVHGAARAAQAAAAGAVAVLTDPAGEQLTRDQQLPVVVVDDARRVLGPVASWIYGEPSTRLQAFGVTGTNGKTTTSYLLEAALRHAGETTGLIGTS